MKLEYFGIHGRAIPIRLLLSYCNVPFEDHFLTFAEFGKKKAEGAYTSGQVPVLTLDDGTQLSQSKAILRYLGKTYKGRNGETLYPGHADPLLSLKIDALIDTREDQLNSQRFMINSKPGQEEFDEKFTDLILNKLPAFLESIDEILAKHNKKYLFTNSMTIADISLVTYFYLGVYNDEFSMCHILQSVIERYPRVAAYLSRCMQDFRFWKSTYKLPSKDTRPTLGYWKIRGLSAALRYQLAYCGVDFKQDLYEQGDGPEFSRQTWLSKKEKLGLDYPNLPYFIDGDFKMTETSAIHQYIADKWAPLLNGQSTQDKAKAGMVGNIVEELIKAVTFPCYSGEKDKILASIGEKLPKIIAFMGSNKFLIGPNPIWVDFRFFEAIELMCFINNDLLVEYPELRAYQRNVSSLPKLCSYLSDPNCPERSLTFNNKVAKLNNQPYSFDQGKEKIFLLGGTGRTGLLFAQAALDKGYKVTAAVRRPPTVPGTLATSGAVIGTGSSTELDGTKAGDQTGAAHLAVVGPHPNLTVVEIKDQTDPSALSPHMTGNTLVVVALGGFPKADDKEMFLHSSAAKGYVPSMLECGIKRVFTIFGAGLLGETVAETYPDTADGGAPHPIPLIQRDCKRAYDILTSYDMDYTIWCPADFPGGEYSDKYVVKANENPGAYQVTTGMVAHSMCQEISDKNFIRQRVGISRTDME